jgi:hypothetical protein
MYVRALQGKEKAWGPVHTSTLEMVKISASCTRSRPGWQRQSRYEKAMGADHPEARLVAGNLDVLHTMT